LIHQVVDNGHEEKRRIETKYKNEKREKEMGETRDRDKTNMHRMVYKKDFIDIISKRARESERVLSVGGGRRTYY
jgi:hypothetical protein